MNETLKQIAIGAAGSFVTIVLITLWGWISDGGFVHVIGGVAATTFDEELRKVRMQVTEVNQTMEEAKNQIPAVSPRGAIVAFDRDDLGVDHCPEGWDPFELPGHVIVGAGSDAPYRFRDLGGAAEHTLAVEEMPRHEHHIMNFEWGHTVNGNGAPARIDVDDGPPWENSVGRLVTDARGGGKAHNNMPPYIALYLCKKR